MSPRGSLVIGLVLALSACGGSSSGDDPVVTAPTATPTATTTATPKASTPGELLRQVAEAEETYYVDTSAYLAFTKVVPAALDGVGPVPAGTRVAVGLLPGTAFCAVLYLEAQKSLAYYASNQSPPLLTTASEVPEGCKAVARTLIA
jgi:hypothetical protein